MGHQGSVEKKVKAIENIDARIIKPLLAGLEAAGEPFRLMVLPDHPTPICVRTHTSDDVPYLLYDSTKPLTGNDLYNEEQAAQTGIRVEKGHELIRRLFEE